MPTRRQPTSDSARDNALETAVLRIRRFEDEKKTIPVTEETKKSLFELHEKFRKELNDKSNVLEAQVETTSEKSKAMNELREALSQFLQVFNFGVARGTFNATERVIYKLDTNQDSVPTMNSEEDLRTIAKDIIDGEASRIEDGRIPMTNPSIEYVQEAYDRFMKTTFDQEDIKTKVDSEIKDIVEMREMVDIVLRDAWDEIEFFYRKETPEMKRKAAASFGVIYYTRPGEKLEEGVFPSNPVL